MYPELFQIGAWTLRTYSLITEIGIIVGLIVAYKLARRNGIPGESFLDLAIWTIIAGIVGSRLYYVVIAWEQEQYALQPIRILYSWEGGLVFQGAIVGGLLALVLLVRRHRLSFLQLADVSAVGLSIGHAIGRWACLFEGCCYGEATTLPWGIKLPLQSEHVHPTMIYESLANIFIFALLWRVEARKPANGFTFSLYLVTYSTARFMIEFLRGDPAAELLGLRLAQWICLATIGAGLILMFYVSRTTARAPQVGSHAEVS